MANEQFTTLPQQPGVEEIANRLQAIAAQLAGFKPTLDTALEDVPADIGNTLVLLGGMADYMNVELSILAERLEVSVGVGV
ncbi:hypothetical protein QN386_10415 [Pseudomonas sp. CCI3.2]|uniref:hypothetical protein n=1 Tax=unclassified Pseudomonas TaxID=196821 RepID=UPI002AC8BE81|nr:MULTISPECIES: hypothetical protein [unclassified Pseudomonas]MEB0078278.1 hypothetical protein [Pseudomonas sp. MH10out]MEB0101732.1 hypothetical protein [Pseudomonas sp. CCI3.2]MEB0160082.1 hypothetical protein [Pseudomonas sp. AH2 (2023)]MEB0168019.1 hypothetical protein [Pseudomonas sp. CCC4.4]WPX28851.1 hypothetical protein RHM64_04115 [Pseudomonas sp. AH2]